MNLLAAKLYDPAVAVSKATSALLAMTALDTTNLRLAVTVPAHGMLYFRVMGGAITGATTVPTIFLGVLNGSTVIARISPQDFPGTMNAATQSCPLYAEFVVTGLTPGAMNVDLAYGVEVVVASTNIKYGGPNDTTTNNAWGGISFQVWDPQPMETTFKTDYTAARAALLDNLDAAVSTRSTYAGADTSGTTTLLSRVSATRATNLDNLDATISSRSTYAGGAVASVTGNVGGNVVGSVASVTAGVTVSTNNDKTGYSVSSLGVGVVDAASLATDAAQEIADTVLDRADAIESGLTVRGALRLCSAALAGVVSGAATATITIRNAVANSKARLTGSVDADGNRTAVVTDVT